MGQYDGRAGKFDIIAVRGADMAFTITATSGGDPVDLSAATIDAELYDSAGEWIESMVDVVSGAGNNIITLSLTDAATADLAGASYPWTLWVTRGGDKRPWLAGRVRVVDSSNGVKSTDGDAVTLTVDSDINVSIDVLGVGGNDVDVAGYINDPASATTTALAAQYAPLSGLGRTVAKLRAGTNIAITYLGDSGLEGDTATAGLDCASVIKTTLDARFSVTTTKNNRAVSGRTLGTIAMTSAASPSNFAAAITDAADLYVISFGHNDIRAEVSAAYTPGNGYRLADGKAALEHFIRKIRIEVPDADIIVSSTWPYTGALSKYGRNCATATCEIFAMNA
jgi:hypothetical protein